jgi:predicted amidophosphoribosyltransferase
MSDDPLSFEQHRRRREENASLVRCARCGKSILVTLTRCPQCGVHFQGEAQDFSHESEQPAAGRSLWFVAAAIVLLIAFTLTVLGLL